MTYSFIHDVPADESIYRKVRSLLPADPPKGLVAHLVIQRDNGLREVDVWDTEADWTRFRDEHVEPAVTSVLASLGIPNDESLTSFEQVHVIDAWLGAEPSP